LSMEIYHSFQIRARTNRVVFMGIISVNRGAGVSVLFGDQGHCGGGKVSWALPE
jgi:hypothetical protein